MYQYDIEIRGTKVHVNALSGVPLHSVSQPHDEKGSIDLFYKKHFDDLPVTCVQILKETHREPLPSQVLDYVVRRHFSLNRDEKLKPYVNRRYVLDVYQGWVIWGNCVIISDILREKVMTELYSRHIGIVKIKVVATPYVWWPKLYEEIEEFCKAFSGCRCIQNTSSTAPVKFRLRHL